MDLLLGRFAILLCIALVFLTENRTVIVLLLHHILLEPKMKTIILLS